MTAPVRTTTPRGFTLYRFTDRYGADCSLQESSLATESAVWLGCDHVKCDDDGAPIGARMHLTQEQVAELLPLLQHFAQTGYLP